MVEYAKQIFEWFNFADSESEILEPEPPTTTSESDASSAAPTSCNKSYVEMVTENPSPPPAWAAEWKVADHVGFTPPTKLQMAQQRLAFSLMLTAQVHEGEPKATSLNFGLIPDLVGAVCSVAQQLRFPRVGAEVKFHASNALSIDTTLNRQYDRIYVGAQASAADLAHFQALLAPGGCLIGPFDGEFLRVQRGSKGQSDDFEAKTLMRVAYAPLVRPGAGEDPMVLAPPPPPSPPRPAPHSSAQSAYWSAGPGPPCRWPGTKTNRTRPHSAAWSAARPWPTG